MIFAEAYHRHVSAPHPPVQRAYELVRDADFLALLIAAGIVFYAGLLVSARHPKVYQMGRWIGAFGFFAYVAAGMSFDGYDPLDCLFAYSVKGAAFAILAIGTSRFVGTLAVWSWDALTFLPGRLVARMVEARRRAEAEARRLHEEQEGQRREEQDRLEREQRRRDAEEHQRRSVETAKLQAIEQRRRVDARAECELYYGKHLKELASRFPKSMFNSFMQTYMNDRDPVDAVEERGKQLRRIMRKHRKAAARTPEPHTVQKLTDWFLNEKERIESLPIDEELREEHLVQLNIRYDELTRDVLQNMQP